MTGLVERWFARLADWRAAAVPGGLLALVAFFGAATGWDPVSSSAWLGLAVLTALALCAGAVAAAFDPELRLLERVVELLVRVGGALALGGLVLHVTSAPIGHVEISGGAPVETWRPDTPAGGPRHLGRWLESLVWDPVERRGMVTIRKAGQQAQQVPLAVGRPVQLGDLRLTPVAHAAQPRPAAATLTVRQRGEGRSEEVTVAVGQTARAGKGSVTLVATSADFNGQGPALQVETRLGEGPPDRRWLFVSAPAHDLDSRRGPIAVTIRSTAPTSRLRLVVDPRRHADLAWLGLALLAIGAALAPSRRRR